MIALIRDGSSLKMLEQHRKHRTEVMTVAVAFSVSTSEGMQENTIVASGDRDGQVFVWHRERCESQSERMVKDATMFYSCKLFDCPSLL